MPDQPDPSATDTAEQTAEQKPTETVEFWKTKAREQERRAKENATAAARLKEIEDAQKSDSEKAAERIRQLEAERDNAHRETLRFRVASQHGISSEDADLFLTGADEETLTRQAERLAGRDQDRAKQGNYVAREGNAPNPPAAGDEREFVRDLFARSD